MKKVFIVLAAITNSFVAFSQVAPADTSTRIMNIQEEKSPSASSSSDFSNVIRWNVAELGRGIFSFGYERRIINYLSADIQLGYSFRDFGGELYDGTFDIDNDYYGNEDYDPFGTEGTSYSVNGAFNFMLGIRIYPFGRGNMEGFYVEPHYYSKKWDFEKTITNAHYGSVDYNTGYEELYEKLVYNMAPTEKDLGLKCGWQFAPGDRHFYFNAYTGLALRSKEKYTIESVDFQYFYRDDKNHTTGYYKKTIEKKNVPGIFLGFSLGVGF